MTDTTTNTPNVREDWLDAAVNHLRPVFAEADVPLPEIVHVSTGFGLARSMGENSNIRAMTFAKRASDDGESSVFVSPFEKDTPTVILVLVHELIHVALDCEDGHVKRFREIAKKLGLEPPLTSLQAGPALAATALTLAEVLGPYPHAGMDALKDLIANGGASKEHPAGADGVPKFHSAPKTQTNRTVACSCPECGYRVRTTRQWLDIATPLCPVHEIGMEIH